MFQNIFIDYSWASATVEIFSMLLWAFILWLMFWWFIKPQKRITEITQIAAAKEAKIISEDTAKGEVFSDNFQLIEWIGPAIEKVLHKYGVKSYKDMVDEDVEWLEEILAAAGSKYKIHNPATWPDQARLAMQKKWKELEEYQEILSAWRQ